MMNSSANATASASGFHNGELPAQLGQSDFGTGEPKHQPRPKCRERKQEQVSEFVRIEHLPLSKASCARLIDCSKRSARPSVWFARDPCNCQPAKYDASRRYERPAGERVSHSDPDGVRRCCKSSAPNPARTAMQMCRDTPAKGCVQLIETGDEVVEHGVKRCSKNKEE